MLLHLLLDGLIHVIESLTSKPDMAIVTGNEPQRDHGKETEL